MAPPFRTAQRWITKRVAPDYTNQLDLFSEAPLETPEPDANARVRASAVSPRAPAPEQLRFSEWVPLPLDDATTNPTTPPVAASVRSNDAAADGPPVKPDIDAKDEIPPAIGTGDRRDPAAGKLFDIEPEAKPSRDFRITAAHRIGQGSLHEKARDNIAAIRLLKALEAETRDATEDEKAVLARYVGWGAMPNVFGYAPPGEWRNTAAAGEGTAHRAGV